MKQNILIGVVIIIILIIIIINIMTIIYCNYIKRCYCMKHKGEKGRKNLFTVTVGGGIMSPAVNCTTSGME